MDPDEIETYSFLLEVYVRNYFASLSQHLTEIERVQLLLDNSKLKPVAKSRFVTYKTGVFPGTLPQMLYLDSPKITFNVNGS